ncbi:hypothetical protein LCGC14_1200080 [marine sediment metagenome]|uniref:Uncharacterized protein n=1 Tax=marine sediment metagenome TaxID=412755 RepID=A0A0F9PM06_9ZZZZ
MTDNDRLGAAIEQHVSKLEAENEKLKESLSASNHDYAELMKERTAYITVYIAENAKLKAALLEFGRHGEGCPHQWDEKYRCKCGWKETLDALKD